MASPVLTRPSASPWNSAAALARFGLPGAAATTLMALGAMVIGWLAPAAPLSDDAFLAALRASALASVLAKIAVVVGAGLLLQTWLRLNRHTAGLSISQSRTLGSLALVWTAPLLAAPVLFSRDVFSYIAHSRLMPAGIDPYLFGTGALPTYLADGADPLWASSPAPYGPLWMGISSGVHAVTNAEPTAALLAFRLLALAGVGLMVWFLPRLAEAAGADPGRAVWLATLNPLIVFHFGTAAHNDALMIGLLVAGFALVMTRRPLLGVLLIVAAGAIKSPALLALPFAGLVWAGSGASWPRRIGAWAWVGTVTVAAFGVLGWVTGLSQNWLVNLRTPAKVETWLSPSTAVGKILGAPAEAFGWASGDAVLAGTRTLGAVAALAVIAWLVFTPDRRTPLRGFALGLGVLVLLGPVIQPWYVLWVLPVLAAAGLTARETRWVVGLSLGLSVYTLANVSATTAGFAALPDSVAAAASVAVMLAMVFAPPYARRILLPDAPAARTPAVVA